MTGKGRHRAILLVATMLAAVACSSAEPPGGDPARVIKVHDGDTIVVEIGGKRENVRLLGVDTPEMNIRTGEPELFALPATLFTKEQAGGTVVTLASDPLNDDRDHYGRLLRYVHLPGGELLNLELVRKGYGFALLQFPLTWRERFVQAEIEARNGGRGLWSPDRIRTAPYQEAAAFEGRAVAVRGVIVATKTISTRTDGRICFLNFHADYKRFLSVVISEVDFRRFGGNPASLYEGRMVTVTGRVRDHRGRLQIRVVDPGQIVSDR